MKFLELLSLPRSLFFNVKLFGFTEGVLCPILINNKVKCSGIQKGKIRILSTDKYRGMIMIGWGGSKGIRNLGGDSLIIGEQGRIDFLGTAGFGEGTSIRVDKGVLEIGRGFSCNKNGFFSCTEGISFGNDVLLGWNVNIRDSDGHSIYVGMLPKPSLKSVIIGNHVWIASHVDILKGSIIPDGCVIAYRSLVTRAFKKESCLIAGHPASVVQELISWEH